MGSMGGCAHPFGRARAQYKAGSYSRRTCCMPPPHPGFCHPATMQPCLAQGFGPAGWQEPMSSWLISVITILLDRSDHGGGGRTTNGWFHKFIKLIFSQGFWFYQFVLPLVPFVTLTFQFTCTFLFTKNSSFSYPCLSNQIYLWSSFYSLAAWCWQ